MSTFWHNVGAWITSIWSHHPTTAVGWAYLTFMVTVSVSIVLALRTVKSQVVDAFTLAAATAAAVEAALGAYAGSALSFWGHALIAVALSFNPIRNMRARAKKRKAAAAKP